jgi:LDH2 family malate/lactate/ureidoglycolate dehydrogenase
MRNMTNPRYASIDTSLAAGGAAGAGVVLIIGVLSVVFTGKRERAHA